MKADSTSNPASTKTDLQNKFSEYPRVRKIALEILQTTDFSAASKVKLLESAQWAVDNATKYWLSHSLLALVHWINGQRKASQEALSNSLKLDIQQTALFWVLVCHQANRSDAAMQWLKLYVAKQDETAVDEECCIIIDAYTNGLFGDDPQGEVALRLQQWFDNLADSQECFDSAIDSWLDYFRSIRTRLQVSEYPHLRQYCNSWPDVKEAMEAHLSQDKIVKVLEDTRLAESSPERISQQMHKALVSFLSKETIDEKKARPEHVGTTPAKRNYLQMLAAATANRGNIHFSGRLQRQALCLSREIAEIAYNSMQMDVQNIMHQPIYININGFNGKTCDGRNKEELTTEFDAWLNHEQHDSMECHTRSCGCVAVMVLICVILLSVDVLALFGKGTAIPNKWLFLAIFAAIVVWAFKRSGDKSKAEEYNSARAGLNTNRKRDVALLRSTLDEIIEIRAQFVVEEQNNKKVQEYLGKLEP